jgi:NADH:ubiquinone oxidoreductase subunit 6 (subunit J)
VGVSLFDYIGVIKNWFIFLHICILGLITLITSRTNPVYIVISFVGLIVLLAAILKLYGAEFFALVLLIIYSGVFAVLFLFIVIMYQPRQHKQKEYEPFKISIFLLYVILPIIGWEVAQLIVVLAPLAIGQPAILVSDIEYFLVLFNDY